MAVSAERVEVLIGLLLDGHATTWSQEELARAARQDPGILRLVRQQLLIAELISQEVAPERSPQAFGDGLAHRQQCDADGAAFTAAVMGRIASEPTLTRARSLRLVGEAVGLAAAALLLLSLLQAVTAWLGRQERSLEPALVALTQPASHQVMTELRDADGAQR